MRLLNQVKSFLRLDFAERAKAEIRADENTAGRKVATRYSRGSVGIQKNAFQTRDELDRALAKAGIPHR